MLFIFANSWVRKWYLVRKSHFWNIEFKLLIVIIIIDAFLIFKFTFHILLQVCQVVLK